MTISYNASFRVVRPTTTMDPFRRYYYYQVDDHGAEYNIHRDPAEDFSSIKFVQVEQMVDREEADLPYRASAQAILDQNPDREQAVVEFFQWSYGGFEGRDGALRNCPDSLVNNWNTITSDENVNNNAIFDMQDIPSSAKLKLFYYEPPLYAGGNVPGSLQVPPYNFGAALKTLSDNHFFLGGQFNITRNINLQSDTIRTRFVDFFRSEPLDSDLVEDLLYSLYQAVPGFGNQNDDQSVEIRGDAGLEKFQIMLSSAPIIIVGDGAIRRKINDLAKTTPGGDGTPIGPRSRRTDEYAWVNLIAVEEAPVRATSREDLFIEGGIEFEGITYNAQVPLRNLLEVYYALMGTAFGQLPDDQADTLDYGGINLALRNNFGLGLLQQNFYNSLDFALKQSREDFDNEEPFLTPLLSSGPPAVFEYYDFNPFGKNVFDYQSYYSMTGDTETPQNIEATLDFSAINPEYNYYAQDYEEAIAPSNIPESVLPNMYIYSFVADRNNAVGERPRWNEQDNQLQDNFDRLITLDEFDATSLPALGAENNEQFLQYLENYSNALAPLNSDDDTGITIDFISDLARQYYNLGTPASQMDMFNRLNGRKVTFPMYIEVGFPMGSVGTVGSLIDQSLSSTAFIDSVIKSKASPINFYVAANGFTLNGGATNPVQRLFDTYNFDEPALINKPDYSLVSINSQGRVFNFEDWISNAMTEIEAAQMAQDEEEAQQGECPGVEGQMNAQAVEDLIRKLARQNMKPYSEILKQKITSADSETIIYKLTKRRIDENGVVGDVIQQFYFPNTVREHLVKFVDTQVKYDQQYRYELYGISVVYGSRCEMSVLGSNLDTQIDTRISTTMAVVTKPNPKIVEHPIHVNAWNSVSVGGLAFPDIRVDDRPPPPPQILIAPYRQNYRQVLLALYPSNEVFIQKRAIEWILLNEQSDWEETFRKSILFQKQFKNYALSSPKLEFAGESGAEIKRMEIFRSTTIPPNARNAREFYRYTFNGKRHKVLDISGDPEVIESERAIAFDCIDTLEPNTKYYYTARAVDVHGKVSNPTPVYEVELVYDRGTYYPYVDLYQPKYKSRKKPTRRMSRFLEIKPAPIQTAVKNTFDDTSKLISSEKGFIPNSTHSVENNMFVVRLTSRDTGRKIQFNLIFKKTETTEET